MAAENKRNVSVALIDFWKKSKVVFDAAVAKLPEAHRDSTKSPAEFPSHGLLPPPLDPL